MRQNKVGNKIFIALGILQLFVSVSAIPAGIGFILDSSGNSMGMSIEAIEDSPFDDYFIPGMILFTVNGIGSLIGSFLSFSKHKYAKWFGISLGSALLIWIIAQVYWMGLVSWLQPFILVLGILELYLVFTLVNKLNIREKNKINI